MSDKVIYDDYNSCNSCSAIANEIQSVYREPYWGVVECNTTCGECGHRDYWAHGWYVARGNSRKYYYENGQKLYYKGEKV